MRGTGFPTVNSYPGVKPAETNIPLNITPSSAGVSFKNVFASEFGMIAMSSFESMSATLAPEHWAMHAGQPSDICEGFLHHDRVQTNCTGDNVMAQRNQACD